MAVKIYGSFRSPFVLVAALAAYEKGQEFELVMMDIKSPEYMNNFNPFGKIPAYQDEDITLYESKAIVRYIADKFKDQGTPLHGSTLTEQALCNQWMEIHSHSFTPIMMDMGKVMMGTAQADLAELTGLLERLAKVLDVYEARLSKSKYLAGDTYTLADLVQIPLFSIFMAKSDEEGRKIVTSRPHLKVWVEAITSRPAWKKVVDRPENTFYGK